MTRARDGGRTPRSSAGELHLQVQVPYIGQRAYSVRPHTVFFYMNFYTRSPGRASAVYCVYTAYN